MDYIFINASVRRVDGQRHDPKDLEDFSAFWKEHYNPGRWNGEMPELSENEKEIWATYNNYAYFEEGDVVEFAKTHPHLTIRVEVNGEESPGQTDYLYQGALLEELHEIRYVPRPQVIDWPEGDFLYSKQLRDEKFLHCFGDHVMMALHDMMENTSCAELGRYVLESMGWQQGNELLMFSAVVGWDFHDLLGRAEETLKEMEENE